MFVALVPASKGFPSWEVDSRHSRESVKVGYVDVMADDPVAPLRWADGFSNGAPMINCLTLVSYRPQCRASVNRLPHEALDSRIRFGRTDGHERGGRRPPETWSAI